MTSHESFISNREVSVPPRPLRPCAWFALTFLFAATRIASAVPPGLPPGAVEEIGRVIRAEVERQKIPGLSAAAAVGEARWEDGFGTADVENAVPATAETVYRTASVAKPITAVAVMQLVERGKIDLDAPIQTYVPSFPEKKWPLTARHLLSHTGGVRWYRGDEINSTKHYARGVDALAIFRDDTLEFEPGTRYHYSTYGYNLLGAAIEGASQMSFMDYVNENIFEPAGMSSTRDDDPRAIIPHRAAGYRRSRSGELRNSALSDTSNKVPGGGLCSTAGDLVAFARAFQDGKLVRPETVAQMTTMQRIRDREPIGYGLGWNLGRHDGRAEVSHGGRQPRVTTMLYTRPDRKLAVALMCNLEGAELLTLARKVADLAE